MVVLLKKCVRCACDKAGWDRALRSCLRPIAFQGSYVPGIATAEMQPLMTWGHAVIDWLIYRAGHAH